MEEHCTIAAGYDLFSCGSWTSCASAFPVETHIGRHVGIAVNTSANIGFRHPMEAVCMDSSVFNFNREYVASYFAEYEKTNGSVEKYKVPTPQHREMGVTIGNDVWIGANVILKPNITIGDGAIIASHSIVTKDVAPYTLVAGSPAVFKRHRFDMHTIAELMKIQFWHYELGDFFKNHIRFDDPKQFIADFYKHQDKLRLYEPRKFYPHQYFALSRFDFDDLADTNYLIDCFGKILFFDVANQKLLFLDKPVQGCEPVAFLPLADNDLSLWLPSLGKYVAFNQGNMPVLQEKMQKFAMYSQSINGICAYGIQIEQGKFLGSSPNGQINIRPHKKEWELFYLSINSFPNSIVWSKWNNCKKTL